MENCNSILDLLESKQSDLNETKQEIYQILSTAKDSSLLNELYDYYLASSSIRAIEILVSVHEPNDKYLMDKLCDTMKGPTKMQCLNLLGHILRRQPSWVHKISQHQLLRDLIKLLKNESEILPLMSALLSIIVLLPMIPASIGHYLEEMFEIFSRLAAWNCINSGKLVEDQLVHLQVALYALFIRLYGMYPCNFLAYLRNMYRSKDHASIFVHTIKPMLDTVRMHPLLVIATKESETTTARWKRFEQHEIIVECEKLTLDMTYNSIAMANSCHQKYPLENSVKFDPMISYQLHQTIKNNSFLNIDTDEKNFWSPSMFFLQSNSPSVDSTASTSVPQTPIPQINMSTHNLLNSLYAQSEAISPPEPGVEATPDTTASKPVLQLQRPPANSTAVRALNPLKRAVQSANSTPVSNANAVLVQTNASQPTSPMRPIDSLTSPFRFPMDSTFFLNKMTEMPATTSAFANRPDSQITKLNRIMHDRCQSVSIDHDKNSRVKTPSFQPTSPLRIISASDNSIINVGNSESPVPIDTAHHQLLPPITLAMTPHQQQQLRQQQMQSNKTFDLLESVIINGSETAAGTVENSESSQEDQEVLEIVRQGEMQMDLNGVACGNGVVNGRGPTAPQCDSVIEDDNSGNAMMLHDDDFDACEPEKSSPCASGGLHMPNSRSMIDFARRVSRLRFYSQCMAENVPCELSDLASPTTATSFSSSVDSTVSCCNASSFRRAQSCPEMKKNTSTPMTVSAIRTSSDASQSTLVPDCFTTDSATFTTTGTSVGTTIDSLATLQSMNGHSAATAAAATTESAAATAAGTSEAMATSNLSSSIVRFDWTSSTTVSIDDENCAYDGDVAASPQAAAVYDQKCRFFGSDDLLMVTRETQTDEFWPMPYEHLFLCVFPLGESKPNGLILNSSPVPESGYNSYSRSPQRLSPYGILDKYIESAVAATASGTTATIANHEKKMSRLPKMSTEQELRYLRDQLGLVHLQLQFERHRREVHALRNRRLLGESRSNQALSEQNAALLEQVVFFQCENEHLQQQLDEGRSKSYVFSKEHQDAIKHWRSQFESLNAETSSAKQKHAELESAAEQKDEEIARLNHELQEAQGALVDKQVELKLAREKVEMFDQVKAELHNLQKELLLMGEVQMKYQERLNPLDHYDTDPKELALLTDTYNDEIKNLHAQLESKTLALEACKSRITELENTVKQHESAYAKQIELARKAEHENKTKLQMMETKYENNCNQIKALENDLIQFCTSFETKNISQLCKTQRKLYTCDQESNHNDDDPRMYLRETFDIHPL